MPALGVVSSRCGSTLGPSSVRRTGTNRQDAPRLPPNGEMLVIGEQVCGFFYEALRRGAALRSPASAAVPHLGENIDWVRVERLMSIAGEH